MIEVKNISKKFNNNVVLNGIDLNINKGDVVAIIGPSGTGKSTFLRCLNRLEKPESGSISIGDLSVDLARSLEKRPAWYSRDSISFPKRQHWKM